MKHKLTMTRSRL